MNHPACTAPDLETSARGQAGAVVMCVFHLIAGVAVAFLAIGGAALLGAYR